MARGYIRGMIAIQLIAAGLLAAGSAQPAPATAPAERAWGKSQAGVAVSVVAEDDWQLDGAMGLSVAVRNRGAIAVPLPPAEAFFGYLMIRQRNTTYYTERIHHARGLAGWGRTLGAGRTVELPAIDVAGLRAFTSKRGLKLVDGSPTETAGGKPVARKPAGTVAEVLTLGPARVQHLLYLPRGDERPLLLKSRVAKPAVVVSKFAALSTKARAAVLADLADRVRKDAFSAQAVHGDAVGIGAPAVTAMIEVVNDRRAPGFARMWAATALADIGGDRAVEALIACLEDAGEGVRHVAAYHGLKLRNARFDQAVNAKAVGGKSPSLTAWTLLGYCQFRGGKAPPKLVAAAVDSKNARVRGAVAEVFTRMPPVPAQLPYLRKLVRDPVEQVRHAAAVSLARARDRSGETVGALIDCLAKPGDRARRAAADALCRITGKDWPYPTGGTVEEKQAVVEKWKTWGESRKRK